MSILYIIIAVAICTAFATYNWDSKSGLNDIVVFLGVLLGAMWPFIPVVMLMSYLEDGRWW